MKELTTLNANFFALTPKGPGEKFFAQIEIALVISEISYVINNTGAMVKERTAETVRFSTSPECLRKFAKTLTDYANEADTELSEALRENREAIK